MLFLNRFVNVIKHIGFKILLKIIFLTHLIEDFEFDFLLLVKLGYILQNLADFRNVVSHDHTGKGLNKYEN